MAEERKQLVQQILLQQIEVLLEAENKEELKKLLAEQRSSDIAEIVQLFDNEQRRAVFDVLEKGISAEVLEKVDQATRDEIFDLLDEKELQTIFSELGCDDAADLLAELPEGLSEKVLKNLPSSDAAEIKKLMTYSEDSAGGIMDPMVISVPEDATITEAVNKIRSSEIDEDFYSIFVVDKNGKFLGDIRIRHLLTKQEDMKINELIDPDTIYVTTGTDQEEVRNIFRNNDLIVVPVLDKNHRLVGRITADRIIEVADEEAAEDIYAMAGTEADELEDVSVFRAARIRMTWLLPCMIGTGITSTVLMFFNSKYDLAELAKLYTVAVAFVPMIAAISGNAGLQTSAIVVSGLATGHLAALKLRQVVSREVRVALLVAISCGIIGGLVCAVLLNIRSADKTVQTINLMSAFGTAMFSAIMVATTLGLFLPFLFRKIGIDPAISSGPLVTTANDSISVAIYMTLALILAG